MRPLLQITRKELDTGDGQPSAYGAAIKRAQHLTRPITYFLRGAAESLVVRINPIYATKKGRRWWRTPHPHRGRRSRHEKRREGPASTRTYCSRTMLGPAPVPKLQCVRCSGRTWWRVVGGGWPCCWRIQLTFCTNACLPAVAVATRKHTRYGYIVLMASRTRCD